MDKRKKPGQRKVKIAYTPAADWDVRLKRVMELLLQCSRVEDTGNRKGGEYHAKGR